MNFKTQLGIKIYLKCVMSLISRAVVDNTREMVLSFLKESKGSTWENMMIDSFYSDFCKDTIRKRFDISCIVSLLKGKRDIEVIKFLLEFSLGSSWVMEMCLAWYGEFDVEGKVCFNIHTILLCM